MERVIDLGCVPGLYSRRMAKRGARVTGVDFLQGNDVHIEVRDDGGDLRRIDDSVGTDATVTED